MINDQYKLEFVDQLVNCKTITCNHVHYRPAPIFMVHLTYANILKNIYKKVRKIVDIG
jgi:hypothetical protein